MEKEDNVSFITGINKIVMTDQYTKLLKNSVGTNLIMSVLINNSCEKEQETMQNTTIIKIKDNKYNNKNNNKAIYTELTFSVRNESFNN